MLDLHSHTTASDGLLLPAALVARAAAAGVQALAVTDHDTLAGLVAAREAAAAVGIEIITGVELSATRADGSSLHVLGYLFDELDAALGEVLWKLSDARQVRNARIAERLSLLGMPIDFASMVAAAAATQGQVGRPHFARAMVARGYVQSEEEAFARWLGDGRPACVERFVLSPAEAIEALHRAGGIAVLAHPLAYGRAPEQADRLLKELAGAGADGVEVYYPDHTPGEEAMLRALATRHGLMEAGGGDFHAEPWPERPRIPLGVLAPLRARAEERAQERARETARQGARERAS
ncbi:MAG: PHP domain-containing protein [Deltaproteobacteria bacterium]|nr:PHP domain-containing protein [Deltaproteobacteria bacterium]